MSNQLLPVFRFLWLHRLVAAAFIANAANLPEVNHISGDKTNIWLNNLQWVSHRENVIHAYENGHSKNMGGTHTFAIGVVDNELGEEFACIREWAAARGINYNTGRNILSGCNSSRIIDQISVLKLKSA